MTLAFEITDWMQSDHGPKEVQATAGNLRITVGTHVATHVDDKWSRSVRDEVFLSAYPLALWLATSWWRLRWEPALGSTSVSWRMAHEMAASSNGFLWPRLTFVSDGDTVDVYCHRSLETPIEPIRYLDDFHQSVSILEFEQAIDSFIELVLARLNAFGIRESQLQRMWSEVWHERRDKESYLYRQVEAGLGFDPDEAPTGVVNNLIGLTNEAGRYALAEIAPACSGEDPRSALAQIVELARSQGVKGKLQRLDGVEKITSSRDFRKASHWKRGQILAQFARNQWNIPNGALPDATLSDIFETDDKIFQPVAKTSSEVGLAVRSNGTGRVKLHIHPSNHRGRRFEGARLLGECLAAPIEDHWLLASRAATARQKTQRAFAAELLCPMNELKDYLDGDYSDEAIDEASDNFDVSEHVILNHLRNSGAAVNDYGMAQFC